MPSIGAVTPVSLVPPLGGELPGKDHSLYFEGGRTGVLLIHGLGGTPLEVKSLGRSLIDTSATILCCQLAGHCGTEADLVATSWQDWYASVEEALARLEKDCDTI